VFFQRRARVTSSRRAGDGAAAFHVVGERVEAGGHDDFVVELARAAGDGFIVHGLLLGAVRNADAAAGVDEGNAHAEAVLDFDTSSKSMRAVSTRYCASSSLETTMVCRPKVLTPRSRALA
jgi:hypothetical protein